MKSYIIQGALGLGILGLMIICFMSNDEIDEATYIYRQMANQTEE